MEPSISRGGLEASGALEPQATPLRRVVSLGAPAEPPPSRAIVLDISTEGQIEKTSFITLWLGLAANVCFFIGAAGFLSFSSNSLHNLCDEFFGDIATYMLGFCGFLLSGLVELYLDISYTRSQEAELRASQRGTPRLRSRYYSKNYYVNIGISCLFVVGTIFDIVAFYLWRSQDFETEHYILYAAAYTWLIASIIVVWTGRYYILSFAHNHSIVRLDTVGNLLFFVGTIVDVFTRHIASPDEQRDPQTFRFEVTTTAFWFLNAMFYLWADATRLAVKSSITKRGDGAITNA